MSEFKGTPGPWVADIRGGCVAVYQDGRQDEINGCHRCDERNIAYSNKGAEYDDVVGYWSMDKKSIADYQLIAAAPELLEALQDMVESYQYEASMENPSLLKARAAIAKALGQ